MFWVSKDGQYHSGLCHEVGDGVHKEESVSLDTPVAKEFGLVLDDRGTAPSLRLICAFAMKWVMVFPGKRVYRWIRQCPAYSASCSSPGAQHTVSLQSVSDVYWQDKIATLCCATPGIPVCARVTSLAFRTYYALPAVPLCLERDIHRFWVWKGGDEIWPLYFFFCKVITSLRNATVQELT